MNFQKKKLIILIYIIIIMIIFFDIKRINIIIIKGHIFHVVT